MGRGVATALVGHLAAHAREQRFRSLAVLLEPEELDGALPFLGASGFHTVDRLTTFEARVEGGGVALRTATVADRPRRDTDHGRNRATVRSPDPSRD